MSDAIDTIVRSCRESAAVARSAADRISEEFSLRENEISTSPNPAEAQTEPTESQNLNDKPWETAGVSRATWFRQQKTGRSADPYIPFLLTIWCAIQRGDQLTAERVFVNMLQANLPTIADRRTVDTALRAVIKTVKRSRGAEASS
jgi:hypothetical protein